MVKVHDDGPAAKAGVQQNDVVLAIDDHQIASPEELQALANKSEGKELTLKLLRGSKTQTLQVKAERRERPSYTVHHERLQGCTRHRRDRRKGPPEAERGRSGPADASHSARRRFCPRGRIS